ncbi:signal peptidase I [Lujinxingia vulgaris]|uniref:Signal peptidase I n=1 Tax=Lujinxingia vulgaris TaxID=2600176 RepID=A0A5C6X8G5_9DELT|nr:signal peptidase I [Lujinxingia vulgaris]TXD33414.1 signal peptidase I [Lujinxingia vulgaris]
MPHDTRSRSNARIAWLLTVFSPGLGLVHAGRLIGGLVVNLLVVLLILLVVIAVTFWNLVLAWAAIATLVAWAAVGLLSASRASDLIAEASPQPHRAFQHPLIYTLIALMTFVGPVAIIFDQSLRHLWTFTHVDNLALYPLALPGDTLFVRRVPAHIAPPRRGDLVTLITPETDAPATLRVIAEPGEEIQMQGNTLIIAGQLVEYTPLMHEWVGQAQLDDALGLRAWVEHNHAERYVVAISDEATPDASVPGLALGPDDYFVLADNRSHLATAEPGASLTSDSRLYGPLPADQIIGRPVHIAWSSAPESGAPRLDRIGLPLH